LSLARARTKTLYAGSAGCKKNLGYNRGPMMTGSAATPIVLNQRMLRFYDRVLEFTWNRVWHCPIPRTLDLYKRHLFCQTARAVPDTKRSGFRIVAVGVAGGRKLHRWGCGQNLGLV
jgi:hypothetical protein